jgi:hypothetical protein
MSENPFDRAKLIQDTITKTRHWRTPTLAMVHAAYVSDDLDYMDLERLIDAALRGEPTEIPEPMLRKHWTGPHRLVRDDRPGGVLLYRPTVAERIADLRARIDAQQARLDRF